MLMSSSWNDDFGNLHCGPFISCNLMSKDNCLFRWFQLWVIELWFKVPLHTKMVVLDLCSAQPISWLGTEETQCRKKECKSTKLVANAKNIQKPELRLNKHKNRFWAKEHKKLRTTCMYMHYAYHCAQMSYTLHNAAQSWAVLIIFTLGLQTSIIAQILSIGGVGVDDFSYWYIAL